MSHKAVFVVVWSSLSLEEAQLSLLTQWDSELACIISGKEM